MRNRLATLNVDLTHPPSVWHWRGVSEFPLNATSGEFIALHGLERGNSILQDERIASNPKSPSATDFIASSVRCHISTGILRDPRSFRCHCQPNSMRKVVMQKPRTFSNFAAYLSRWLHLGRTMVVIAIIGLLAFMLMPAVQRARESADASSCLNNIRQSPRVAKLSRHVSDDAVDGFQGTDIDSMQPPDIQLTARTISHLRSIFRYLQQLMIARSHRRIRPRLRREGSARCRIGRIPSITVGNDVSSDRQGTVYNLTSDFQRLLPRTGICFKFRSKPTSVRALA